MVTPNNQPNAPAEQDKANQSGLGHAIIPQWAVILLTLVVILAGSVPAALAAAGVTLPGWIGAATAVIISLGAALGITSPGLRKKE